MQVHRAFYLYVHRLSTVNYNVKWSNLIKFSWERKRQGDKFYCVCLSSNAVSSFISRPSKDWTIWMSNSLNFDPKSISQWRFRWRCRCEILRFLLFLTGRRLLHITGNIICQIMCKRDTHHRRLLGCHTLQVCYIDILYYLRLLFNRVQLNFRLLFMKSAKVIVR